MNKYEFKTNLSEKEFDNFVSNHPLKNVMQESRWGTVKNNWGTTLAGLYRDGELIGTAMLLIRSLPLNIKLLYAPRGYLIDYSDREALNEFTKEIKKYAKSMGAFAVKIDPNICLMEHNKDGSTKEGIDNSHVIDVLKDLGYTHKGLSLDMYAYIQPRFQMSVPLLDKDKNILSDDMLLKSYDRKARKFIGRYQNVRGFSFEKTSDVERLDDFICLLDKTAKRQKIFLRNKKYFKHMMEVFKTSDDITMYFAKLNFRVLKEFLDGQVIKMKEENADPEEIKKAEMERDMADSDLLKYGEEIYTAALFVLRSLPNSSGRGRTAELIYSGAGDEWFMRFRPTIELRYFAMMDNRDLGCDVFNLGGVQGTLTGGLADFKSKFNPVIKEYIGEFDLVINPFIYFLFDKLVPIIKNLRHSLKKKKSSAD